MIDEATLTRWMRIALETASRGVAEGQSPFGAAIYSSEGQQLAVEHNEVQARTNPAAHAEVLAIAAACRYAGKLTLSDCWLISIGEPCPMCAATAAMAGIQSIAFGAPEAMIRKAGHETLGQTAAAFFAGVTAEAEIVGPLLTDDCMALLRNHSSD